MENQDKKVAVLAYLTIVGWILGFILHSKNRTKLGAFHLRQALGVYLLFFGARLIGGIVFLGWIPVLAASIIGGIIWLVGLIAALKEEEEVAPILGHQFQDWFKAV